MRMPIPKNDVTEPPPNLKCYNVKLEAPPGIEPGMEVLQTSALPLGDGAPRE